MQHFVDIQYFWNFITNQTQFKIKMKKYKLNLFSFILHYEHELHFTTRLKLNRFTEIVYRLKKTKTKKKVDGFLLLV